MALTPPLEAAQRAEKARKGIPTQPKGSGLQPRNFPLEAAMQRVDQTYAGNPNYEAKRDAVKYRLQRMFEGAKLDGLTPEEVDHYAAQALNGTVSIDLKPRMKGVIPSVANAAINPDPEGILPKAREPKSGVGLFHDNDLGPVDQGPLGYSWWLAKKLLGAGAEDTRQQVEDVSGTLARGINKKLPEGLINPKTAEILKSSPDQMDHLIYNTLRNMDPTQVPGFVHQLTQQGGIRATGKQFDDLFHRIGAGDSEAMSELAGMITAGIAGKAIHGGIEAFRGGPSETLTPPKRLEAKGRKLPGQGPIEQTLRGRSPLESGDTPRPITVTPETPAPVKPRKGIPASKPLVPDELQRLIETNLDAERVDNPIEPPSSKPVSKVSQPVPHSEPQGIARESAPRETSGSMPAQSEPRVFHSAEGHPFTEERMSPQDIGVKEGLQYKKAGIVDHVNKTTDAMKDVEAYDHATAGPLTVWETNDGKRWVMNGHHRRELALRTGESDVAVRVFKESDGIDLNRARALGALQNIRDGKGTAIDAATVLRDLNVPPETLKKYGLSSRSGVARDAQSLLKLGPDALRMVEEGNVPEAVAAAVADAKLEPRRQAAVLKEAQRVGLETRAQGAVLAERARSAPIIDRSGGTGDLFGELDEGLALGEQAKIGEMAARRLAQSQRAYEAFERARAAGETHIDVEAQGRAAAVQEFGRRVIATDPDVARILEEEAAAYAGEQTPKRLTAAVDRVVRAAEQAADRRLSQLEPNRLGQADAHGDGGRTGSGTDTQRGEAGKPDVLTRPQEQLIPEPQSDLELTAPKETSPKTKVEQPGQSDFGLDVERDGQKGMDLYRPDDYGVFTPDNITRIQLGREPARGRKPLLDRIRLEVSTGGLDADTAALAEAWINDLPDDVLKGLGSSYYRDSIPDVPGAAGAYSGEHGLILIAKKLANNQDHPSRVITHEIAHYIDDLLPDDIRTALERQYEAEMRTVGNRGKSAYEDAQAQLNEGRSLDARKAERQAVDRRVGGLDARGRTNSANQVFNDALEKGKGISDLEDARLNEIRGNSERLSKTLRDNYRYTSFREWVAERIADTVQRHYADELAANGLARLRQIASEMVRSAGEWLKRLGRKDAARAAFDWAMERRGETPAPQRIKKGQSYGPETGKADIRTIATVAGVGAAGAAFIASGKASDAIEYLKKHGLPREAVAGAGVAAALGATLLLARKGAHLSPEGMFGAAKGLLDPATIAEHAAKGDTRATKLFGMALQSIVDAKARHRFEVVKSFDMLHQVASSVFGKSFERSKEFLDMDSTVRDRMEQNVKDGRPWDEGLSEKERAFVQQVRAKVLDPILDKFEGLGGRIDVKNDGTQHDKLKPGSIVRIKGGKYGVFEGTEPMGPALDGDPFGNDVPGPIVRVLGRWGEFDPTDTAPKTIMDEHGMPVDEPIHVIGPGESFGRPVDRLGDSFVPRIYSQEFMRRMRGKRTKAFNDALAKMLEEQNPGGLSGDRMVAQLADIANGAENTGRDVSSFMANLEKERQWELAKFTYEEDGKTITVDPYESSYLKSAVAYVERGWKRVAIAEQFGADPHALGAILRGVKGSDSAYGNYLEQTVGQLLGLGDDKPKGGKDAAIAGAEGSYQALTKLTGGTTHVAQIGDLLMPISEAGLVPFVKGAWRMAHGEGHAGALMAATESTWLPELRHGDVGDIATSGRSKIAKGVRKLATKGERSEGLQSLVDGVWTGLGLRWLDRTVKAVTVLTGAEDLHGAMRKAVDLHKAGKPIPEALQRKLQRYGFAGDVERAAKNGLESVWDEQGQAKFAANVRRRLMYSGSVEDNPLWMSTPYGSMAMRFRKPLVVTTRFIMNNVAGEAAKGNLAPLVRFVTLGAAGGTVAAYLKNAIRLDGWDDETRRLIHKGDLAGAVQHMFAKPAQGTLFDAKQRQALGHFLFAAGKSLYDSGNLGVFGEAIPGYNRRVQDLTGNYAVDLWRTAKPVSVESLDNLARHVLGKKSDIAEENWKQWRDSVQDSIETEVLPLRRLADLTDFHTDHKKVETIQRKLKKGERLTTAEVQTLGRKGYREKGKYEEIRKLKKGAKGVTYGDAVYDSVGMNKDLTFKRN